MVTNSVLDTDRTSFQRLLDRQGDLQIPRGVDPSEQNLQFGVFDLLIYANSRRDLRLTLHNFQVFMSSNLITGLHTRLEAYVESL